MEVPPARPGSGVEQNQLTGRQQGDEIPIESRQAFAAGQHGSGDPAIGAEQVAGKAWAPADGR